MLRWDWQICVGKILSPMVTYGLHSLWLPQRFSLVLWSGEGLPDKTRTGQVSWIKFTYNESVIDQMVQQKRGTFWIRARSCHNFIIDRYRECWWAKKWRLMIQQAPNCDKCLFKLKMLIPPVMIVSDVCVKRRLIAPVLTKGSSIHHLLSRFWILYCSWDQSLTTRG